MSRRSSWVGNLLLRFGGGLCVVYGLVDVGAADAQDALLAVEALLPKAEQLTRAQPEHHGNDHHYANVRSQLRVCNHVPPLLPGDDN
jgi:hypothetical protein